LNRSLRRWDLSKEKPVIETQFLKEKYWVPTTRSEALKIILDEMPQTDAEPTLNYLLSETKKGITVTLGECRFRALQTA